MGRKGSIGTKPTGAGVARVMDAWIENRDAGGSTMADEVRELHLRKYGNL